MQHRSYLKSKTPPIAFAVYTIAYLSIITFVDF